MDPYKILTHSEVCLNLIWPVRGLLFTMTLPESALFPD